MDAAAIRKGTRVVAGLAVETHLLISISIQNCSIEWDWVPSTPPSCCDRGSFKRTHLARPAKPTSVMRSTWLVCVCMCDAFVSLKIAAICSKALREISRDKGVESGAVVWIEVGGRRRRQLRAMDELEPPRL